MSVINTNITSMIGQQNLRESQNALSTSMERLSSGLRINSAKDDAAGQAIANRMSSQISGLAQAQRNANDGISVAQTAEGALNQVNDNLQRIRELSVQAQNDTNSLADLQSIQGEINQRLNEIDRISEETNFNGTKVLASDTKLQIQVGANDGETIEVSLEEINAGTLDLKTFNVSGPENATHLADANEYVSSSTAVDGTHFGLEAGDVSGGTTTFIDDNGNLYAKVNINGTTLSDAQADDLAEQGLRVDTSSATNVAYMLLEADDATVNANGNDDSDNLASLTFDLGAIQNLSAARSRIEDADYAKEVAI